LIQDFFENPTVLQDKKIHRNLSFEKLASRMVRRKIFIHALHGFHLDYFTNKILDLLCAPFKSYMEVEKKWMDWNNKFVKLIIKK